MNDPIIIDTTATSAKVALWERHGQTIMLFVITAVLAFSAKALWDNNAFQARMSEQIIALSNQVAKLEGAVGAMQQQYVTRIEFTTQDARNEGRIQDLERAFRNRKP